MKKEMLTVVATVVFSITGLTVVAQENPKAKSARKEIKEGNKDLQEAKRDSISEFEKFKKDASKRINENQTKIIDLKIKKYQKSEELQMEYDKKVLALEAKNQELQNRIDGCACEDPTIWAKFRTQFGKDMDELNRAIQNMTITISK
jgi:hypothetical protein